MNTAHANLETQAAANDPIFDPFPEPRAYPSGWDLSELPAGMSTAKPETSPTFSA